MTNENLGGNKRTPLTTSVSTDRPDNGTQYFGQPENKASRSLRVAIGAQYGRDLRERIDSGGNTVAAVHFRRPLLEDVAEDIIDETDISELSVTDLRARIASTLNRQEPVGQFNWLHLRDIYEAVIDPENATPPEQMTVKNLTDPDHTAEVTARLDDSSAQEIEWGRNR